MSRILDTIALVMKKKQRKEKRRKIRTKQVNTCENRNRKTKANNFRRKKENNTTTINSKATQLNQIKC